MSKAVVFDLDGTLLCTIPDIADALNAALTANGFHGWDIPHYQKFVGNGIRRAIRRAAAPCEDEEILEAIHRVYQSIYPNHCCDKTHPYPEMGRVLEELCRRGIPVGVLTNKTETTARAMMTHYFPQISFAFVWGSNGSRPLKPDPSAGAEFCRLLGLAPEEVAYVGDSDVDVLFAKAAGLTPVGAVWGYRGREELETTGARLIADSPIDLLPLLTED